MILNSRTEALVSKGMRVDLICLAESAEDPKHEVLSGIDVLRATARRVLGDAIVPWYWSYRVRLGIK